MIHHVSMNDVERAKAFYDPSKALRGGWRTKDR
jgi:hypothetical protein